MHEKGNGYRMKKQIISDVLYLANVLLVVLFCTCSTESPVAGGSGSSTGNGISASVHYPDGKPATGAVVRIRPAEFLADMDIDTSIQSVIDTVTDISGSFTVENVKSGDYTIEVVGDAAYGLLLSESIVANDSLHLLGKVSLVPTGSIQGHVDKAFIDETIRLTIRFYGLDKKVVCLPDGKFIAEKIPASNYTLQVRADDSNEIDLDVPFISVEPGKSTTVNPVIISEGYLQDSVTLRDFLNAMNLASVNWDEIVTIVNNRIRTLNLTGLGLTYLDSSIGDLNFLYTLYLGGNRFESLPAASLKRLTLLSHISFEGGPLDSLSGAITELSDLWSLTLSGTGLKTLPASMANMSSLHELYLDNCGLGSIPAVVYALPSLTLLNVGNNSISEISPLIGNLTNLEKIWINDNRIATLPEEIGDLENLKNLWAYRNLITTCPQTIGQLGETLEILVFESNQLTTLPQSVVNLTAITVLEIGGNKLCTLPAEVDQWIASILGTDWQTTYPQTGCQ